MRPTVARSVTLTAMGLVLFLAGCSAAAPPDWTFPPVTPPPATTGAATTGAATTGAATTGASAPQGGANATTGAATTGVPPATTGAATTGATTTATTGASLTQAGPGGSPAPAPTGAVAGATSAAPAATEAPDPSAPPYVVAPIDAPPVMPGTTHDIDLSIVEKDMTVATGYVVHVWTFGGTVPGPVIRVHLGDTVRVHLTNHATMAHSIDFHASQTAMDDQMVEIAPGASRTYTFRADYAGVWMYHCGTPPALWHIADGMFGMLIVEPRGGLPHADRELAIVQSEWYLGGQGQPASYAKANQTDPSPDFVVFNGVADQYRDHPIAVHAKDRVRIFVLDAGPNEWSSFHVIGTIFDSVVTEGMALTPGNAEGWGSQAVDLAPAQGAIATLTIPEKGMYSFVTHAFDMVGHGASGIIQAG